MVSSAEVLRKLVFHHSLTCNTVAPTSHLRRASMEVQVLISTKQALLKDVNKGNNLLVSSQINQDNRFWAVEHIRRPWAIDQMKVDLEATMLVKTIILAIASRRS